MRDGTNVSSSLSCGFTKLRVKSSIGAYAVEKTRKQWLFISVSLYYPENRVKTLQSQDSLDAAFDYAKAAELVQKVTQLKHYDLLENLALAISRSLKLAFPDCPRMVITLEKPSALRNADVSFCTLSI